MVERSYPRGLSDQIRAEVITLLPEQISLFEDIEPIDFAQEFTATGTLLANATENENVYANLTERLWDETKDEAQLASTTNVFVSALKQLGKGEQNEANAQKRARIVAEITPKRLDRLRVVDRLFILATLARTNNTAETEVDYKIDPKTCTDFVISRMPFLGVDREAVDAHTDVFANIIACQPYYEQGSDLADVVDYISYYFTSRSGRLNRSIDEEFGTGSIEVDTDDPDEVELSQELGGIKIQEFYLGKTIRALEKHPDLYIAFVQKLLDNSTSADAITETIFDFPEDVDLNKRLYDTLRGYPSIGIRHAKHLAKTLATAGKFKEAYAIIEQHGALEDTDDKGPLLRDVEFDGWGNVAAHFVAEAEKQGAQNISDTLTQKILCNERLSGVFSRIRRIDRAHELLANGKVNESIGAILDGDFSFAPPSTEYGWFGGEVITEKYGVELIDAAMEATHSTDEQRNHLYKKWFLETMLRTLVRRELEVELDPSYVTTVKARAARALDSLRSPERGEGPRDISADDARLYALAGEIGHALALYRQDDDETKRPGYEQSRALVAALSHIALSGSREDLEGAMEIYKGSVGTMPSQEERLRVLLTAGALRTGALHHLLTLEKTTPDYNWGKTITTAVQIAGNHRAAALPDDMVRATFGQILRRIKYLQSVDLAGLVDPAYLYKLHLSKITV